MPGLGLVKLPKNQLAVAVLKMEKISEEDILKLPRREGKKKKGKLIVMTI